MRAVSILLVAASTTIGLAAVGIEAVAPGRQQPVVQRADLTPQPIVDPATLREIYAESMDELRRCIDERRGTPDVWADTAGSSFPC